MVYCQKCGNETDSDAKFCNYCGTDIGVNTPVETPSPPSSKNKQSKKETQKETDSSKVIYADFGQRLVAWIIDFVIVAVISIILFSIGEWFFAIIIGYVLALLYFWLLEAFNNGQTVGKMAMKLRTVNEKTLEVAEPIDYLVNNILKSNLGLLIIDVIVGLISNTDDPKNRIRIMQGASNTVVIKTE
jgi:uncharacterized RDD family membrane protein YckC